MSMKISFDTEGKRKNKNSGGYYKVGSKFPNYQFKVYKSII